LPQGGVVGVGVDHCEGRGHAPDTSTGPIATTRMGPMTIYAVTYRYSDDVDTRDRVRPEHRRYLGGLADEGKLLLSGPYAPGEQAGALLLFRADDKDTVASYVADDPFTAAGVITSSEIVEWEPVLGPLRSAIP